MIAPILTAEEKAACLDSEDIKGKARHLRRMAHLQQLARAQERLLDMSAKTRALIELSDRVGSESIRLCEEVEAFLSRHEQLRLHHS